MGKQKEDEEKKDRTALLLQERKKIIYNLVLVGTAFFVVLIGVLTMAWFTMNREVGTGGVSVKIYGPNFEITNVSGSRDGIFHNVHESIHDTSALYWKMTASNNLVNYEPYADDEHPGDQGIKPGSWGEITFNVTPKVASVNLCFDFEIIGYYMLATGNNGTPDDPTDDPKTLTALSDITDHSGDIAQNNLNGHILLFENRTVTGTDDNKVITYSDPILSNEDMHRIFNRSISGKDTATPVSIYWVWPNTLSTLVDARDHTGITTTPLCSGTSYTALTENIVLYPHYYLKGVASTDSIDITNDIVAHYDTYGDMYDQGDNEIGMRVNYVLIKLTVTEGTAEGGGS